MTENTPRLAVRITSVVTGVINFSAGVAVIVFLFDHWGWSSVGVVLCAMNLGDALSCATRRLEDRNEL